MRFIANVVEEGVASEALYCCPYTATWRCVMGERPQPCCNSNLASLLSCVVPCDMHVLSGFLYCMLPCDLSYAPLSSQTLRLADMLEDDQMHHGACSRIFLLPEPPLRWRHLTHKEDSTVVIMHKQVVQSGLSTRLYDAGQRTVCLCFGVVGIAGARVAIS